MTRQRPIYGCLPLPCLFTAFLCVCELDQYLLLFILPIVFTAPLCVCEFEHWDYLLRCVADWLLCAYVNIGIICYAAIILRCVADGQLCAYANLDYYYVGRGRPSVTVRADLALSTVILMLCLRVPPGCL